MNKVILTGNLANDPESRTTQSGIAQCTFRVAVQRRVSGPQGERESDFFTVICWRQLAENCARYLSKGRKVAIEGSLRNRSYEAQDGSRRFVTEIIADNVEFLSMRESAPDEPTRQAQSPATPAPSEFTPYEDDDLPF